MWTTVACKKWRFKKGICCLWNYCNKTSICFTKPNVFPWKIMQDCFERRKLAKGSDKERGRTETSSGTATAPSSPSSSFEMVIATMTRFSTAEPRTGFGLQAGALRKKSLGLSGSTHKMSPSRKRFAELYSQRKFASSRISSFDAISLSPKIECHHVIWSRSPLLPAPFSPCSWLSSRRRQQMLGVITIVLRAHF